MPTLFSNRPYTYNYSQPSEYHFSLDSVELPFRISQRYLAKRNTTPISVLDLCSGCGIIGLEFQHFFSHVSSIDFVEVQSVYESFFNKNIVTTNSLHKNYKFLNINYNIMLTSEWENKYDLVLCNPPYFRPEMGWLSDSEFKNRCRFLIDSNFKTLVEVIAHTLRPHGEAYLLVRTISDHKIDQMQELYKIAENLLSVEELEPVRGTSLVRLQKNVSAL